MNMKTTPKKPQSPKHLAMTKQEITLSRSIEYPTKETPIRHLFRTPITLYVGPDDTPFYLHLEILIACSPFFYAAFPPHPTFRESLTHTLTLPEISPPDFEFFTQWLYTRSLSHEALTGPHPAYFRLLKLWKLADALQVTGLKNAVVDEMARVADATNSCPTPDDTRVVWGEGFEGGCSWVAAPLLPYKSGAGGIGLVEDGERDEGGSSHSSTPPTTTTTTKGRIGGNGIRGLRELVGDLFVWKKTERLVLGHRDRWDEAFLREVVVKLKRERQVERGAGGGGSGERPWGSRRARCERYHVHDGWAGVCEGGLKVEE